MKQTRPSFNFPYSRNHRQQRIGYHPSEPSSLGTPMGTMANPLYMVRVNGAGQVRPRSRNLNRPGETAWGSLFQSKNEPEGFGKAVWESSFLSWNSERV